MEDEEDHAELSRVSAQYSARLDRTLKGLQARVKEQEVALEKLRASTTTSIQAQPSEDLTTHLQQLNVLKLTYDSLTEAQPSLPSTESPIPGLLALRSTHRTIEETKECITQTEIDYKKLKQRLDKEQADLQDAKLMQNAMQARITSLQGDIEAQTQKTPAQIAKDMIRKLEKRKASYDSETMKLVKAFNGFIDDHLAAMLAAEELGGPIVGELLDVDEETLEVGFNAQGKVKKTKVKVKEDKRQRRIDEIWGPQPAEDAELEEPWDEKRAAAAEMRGLTEQLLNRLLEVDGSGSGAYVELERESAAARFLVRSKAAQFHPRDARKLRLIDFGGEVED